MLESEGNKPKYFIHLWDTNIPYCYLSCICHFGWVYLSSFGEIPWLEPTRGHHHLLSLVFHPHPAIANGLSFVSMAYTRDFQKVQWFFKGTGISYLLLLLLLLLSSWFWIAWLNMGFNIHLGAVLTLDACRIILVQHLTYSLGTLTWST